MKWYDIRLNEEELKFVTTRLECDKNILNDAVDFADNEEDREHFLKRYELCEHVLDACYNYKKLVK